MRNDINPIKGEEATKTGGSETIVIPAGDDKMSPKAVERELLWWKKAVVYQIYPRSFQDSNGDGVGDLRGIISRLDYVKSLGIDIIWLNPIFVSPNDDNGYDISNYCDIMPEFGTMEDFNLLLKEVHGRGLKLILDLVVNHTSDEHLWFMQARQSRTNPFYNYYYWWPAEEGKPPFRRSYFDEDGSAWKYNEPTDSYYLHYFSVKQPDLNWGNPEVRREVYKIMRFWFDKGIDGFRMDSIPLIGKDPAFPEIDPDEYPNIYEYYAKNPSLHDYLKEMNDEVLSKYNITTVGEGSAVRASDVSKFVELARRELNMLYHFGPSEVRNFSKPDSPDTGIDYSLIELKQMFTEWDRAVADGWPTVYLGNHDQPRMVSRFADDSPPYHDVSAKMLATFLLTMRGTPYWYAGDEIGMNNIKFNRIEDYNDIATRNEYKRIKKQKGDLKAFLREQKQVSRDNARTPFQWDDSSNAGFTDGQPWLKINDNYEKINVAAEEKDPNSILNYFKKMMVLRKTRKALIWGNYSLLDPENKQVYVYAREIDDEKFLIVLNFSPRKTQTRCGTDVRRAELILCNYADEPNQNSAESITLRPFEALVYRL